MVNLINMPQSSFINDSNTMLFLVRLLRLWIEIIVNCHVYTHKSSATGKLLFNSGNTNTQTLLLQSSRNKSKEAPEFF